LSGRIKIAVACAGGIRRLPLPKKAVRALAACVLSGEKLTRATIDVVFVGAERMRELNSRYLQHDYPADVLAFTLNDDGEPLDGEVYVCVDTARAQAADYRVPLRQEIARLVVHGVLHLTGWDDSAPGERKKMLDRGERLMRGFFRKFSRSRPE